MRLFSRNPEALDAGSAADLPFEPRRTKPRAARARNEGRRDGGGRETPPLDPVDAARTRARRRLIGAVALAAAAVVFVPMLFDRTPATVDDIALQIPDRDTPFEGRRGVPDATRGPLKGSTNLPPAATPIPSVPPSIVAAPDATAATPTESAAPPAAKSPDRPAVRGDAAKVDPTDAAKTDAAKVEPARPDAPKADASRKPADDPRALAALEGRSIDAKPAVEPRPDIKSAGFAVQIAAFSAADKARGLRDQLVANGLKSYTEPVTTTQGPRTRVRLGPFPTREAADRAKDKLRTMKLDGSVVPL